MYVKFLNDDSFVAGLYVLGEENDLLQYTGTYLITDDTENSTEYDGGITLTKDDGDIFDLLLFTISNSEIKIFSSSGAIYSKYE